MVAAVFASLLSFIAVFEGYRPIAYKDPVGVPTVCYGHTGSAVSLNHNRDTCDGLLSLDSLHAMTVVERSLDYKLPAGSLVAFSSFVYNVGEGNWRSSTLLKRLKEHRYIDACYELDRWVYAGGDVLRGLQRRRAQERELCLSSFNGAAM